METDFNTINGNSFESDYLFKLKTQSDLKKNNPLCLRGNDWLHHALSKPNQKFEFGLF